MTGCYVNTFLSPLSLERETECLKKVAQNDKEAKDELILHNMRLVAHVTKKYAVKDFPEIYSNDEIFRKNSTWRSNTSSLKKRILKYNLLEYKCSLCGNEGYWNNKPLVLQLDHIDGDRTNIEITNLRFLCPNCHTQTDTYANKRGSYHKKKN